ncbi:MAG: ankyrin repeat domain-containing protein [Bacteroidetes bacterium]|nr:ankyrin repeat domain-containing protein [Bacteroidota bacterium]
MLKKVFLLSLSVMLLYSCASGPPIYNESYKGNFTRVQALLKEGVSPNTVTPKGWTPLMIASAEGHRDVVNF